IARALLLCEDNLLLPEHFNLPADSGPATGMNLRDRLELVERNLLLDCLQRNQGNQTSAAQELGLPRRTLLYRMQRLNISPADLITSERHHVERGQLIPLHAGPAGPLALLPGAVLPRYRRWKIHNGRLWCCR